MSETVGVVGAGRMGLPIIGHLARAGFRTLATDLDSAKQPSVESKTALWRPDAASNCIHAVSDIDADDGYLTVDGAYGVPASARVVEHLSRWLIQPGREHPSIDEKLGLSGQPITRVAYPFDNDGHSAGAIAVKPAATKRAVRSAAGG